MALLKYSYLIRPKNAFHYTAQSYYFPIFCLVYYKKKYLQGEKKILLWKHNFHIMDSQEEEFMLVEHMQIFTNQNACKPWLGAKSVQRFIYVLGLSVPDQGYAQ